MLISILVCGLYCHFQGNTHIRSNILFKKFLANISTFCVAIEDLVW